MLQAFTNHGVEPQEVVGRDTFAIRRIGYDDALFLWLLKLLERLELQYDVLAQSGCLHVVSSNFVRLRIVVVSINLMVEFTFLRFVVIDRVEKVLIEVHPLFECKFLAEYTRSNVAGNKCRFDRNSTRTTHRVDKVAFALPASHENHTGSQYFVQWSFYRFLTIATAVERFTRTVERQSTTVFSNVDVQQYIRIVDAYRWAFACLVAEVVHDGILHLVCHELGVAEFIGEYHSIDGKALGVVQVLFPSDGLYIVVHFVGSVSLKMFDGFEDTDSGAQAEVCLVH